jgi:hypothetical protein
MDGLPVTDYANKFVSPFEGTSTLQGHKMMVYSTYLLNGSVDQLLNLTLKGQRGKIKEDAEYTEGKKSYIIISQLCFCYCPISCNNNFT